MMVVGDSVTFEVEPGLSAALEHTGLVISANRTQVGFGLSQWPIYFWWEIWPPFLAEVRPEAVVVQTGTWDVYDVWGGEGRIPEPDDPNWEESRGAQNDPQNRPKRAPLGGPRRPKLEF